VSKRGFEKIGRALISVSDKTGVVEFAKGLSELGIEIVSTGGTYKTLTEARVPALYISRVTGFPEILDGRVKTLHPAIHGGILAVRDDPEHQKALTEHHITPVGLVAVNLYPFREAASRPGRSWKDLIENIDIGGPAMVRSAAKNHETVLVVVHPEDYDGVLRQLRAAGDCPREERIRLALAAFRHTAEYDAHIFETLSRESGVSDVPGRKTTNLDSPPFPVRMTFALEKMADLRYGENPGQRAALYRPEVLTDGKSPTPKTSPKTKTLIDALQLQGKELSWNNWLDADSAFKAVGEFGGDGETPGCAAVVVKHMNPCGAAMGETVEAAFEKAYAADPVSAFGGIVAVNGTVTGELARALQTFFQEVVIAPGYSEEARKTLASKTNLRLLEVPEEAWKIAGGSSSRDGENLEWENLEWKSVHGGLLVQECDLAAKEDSPRSWKAVTAKSPSEAELRDMAFAWKIAKHVKSNAIVLAKDGATVGVGAGQPNRVGAAEIALRQAGDKARGAVLASDAFFPFSDTVRLAAKHGVSAIVQPGGSVKDRESIDAADEEGLTMVFTGIRHFKH
jgi:phosphoribosylaminoimidazolecarboxamide formyltransferase/IMP cyclohydrolase